MGQYHVERAQDEETIRLEARKSAETFAVRVGESNRRTFHISPRGEESAFSSQDREYGVGMLIELPNSADEFGEQVPAKGIERLRPVELDAGSARSEGRANHEILLP